MSGNAPEQLAAQKREIGSTKKHNSTYFWGPVVSRRHHTSSRFGVCQRSSTTITATAPIVAFASSITTAKDKAKLGDPTPTPRIVRAANSDWQRQVFLKSKAGAFTPSISSCFRTETKVGNSTQTRRQSTPFVHRTKSVRSGPSQRTWRRPGLYGLASAAHLDPHGTGSSPNSADVSSVGIAAAPAATSPSWSSRSSRPASPALWRLVVLGRLELVLVHEHALEEEPEEVHDAPEDIAEDGEPENAALSSDLPAPCDVRH